MNVSCSWCHEMNDTNVSVWCAMCGHDADAPRMACSCETCQPALYDVPEVDENFEDTSVES